MELTSPREMSTSRTIYSSSAYPFSYRQSRGTVDHTDVCQLMDCELALAGADSVDRLKKS